MSGMNDVRIYTNNISRNIKPIGHIVTILGLVLLFYLTKKAGAGEIIEGIKRLGAGFLLVIATHGMKLIIRSIVWMQCFEKTRTIRFGDAFEASVVGDALSNLIPFGAIVSEPAKALLVRNRVPIMEALSAIIIENIFLGFSVVVFLLSGTAILLIGFALPQSLRIASLATMSVSVAVIFVSLLIFRRRWNLLSGSMNYLSKRGVAQKFLETRLVRAREFEESILSFYISHRSRFVFILLLVGCYQLVGVLDAYLILYFISGSPTSLITAFLIESVHVLINIVFNFVPLRVGVDEAGTGMLAGTFNLSMTTGITLAIIRKGREMCWVILGLLLLARRGLSLRSLATEASAIKTNPTHSSTN